MSERDERRAKLWERLGWLECNYEDWGEFNAHLRAELEASEADRKSLVEARELSARFLEWSDCDDFGSSLAWRQAAKFLKDVCDAS